MNVINSLKELDLDLNNDIYEKLEQYIVLLQQWGKIHNLTSPKSLQEDIIIDNIVDSLYPMQFLEPYNTALDVGTGAGYPGMILAIANQDKQFILVEPRSKRAAFLNYLKSALKLDNVTVFAKRVEQIDPNHYDLITSRAVTNIQLLLKLTSHITDDTTKFLFYKGSMCDDEIKQSGILDYKIVSNGTFRNFLYIKGIK